MQVQTTTQAPINAARGVDENQILDDLMKEMAESGSAPVMSSGMIEPKADETPAEIEAPAEKSARAGKTEKVASSAPAVVVNSLPRRSKKKGAGEKAPEAADASATPETPAVTPLPHWPFPTGAEMRSMASDVSASTDDAGDEKAEASDAPQTDLAGTKVAPAEASKPKTPSVLRNPFAKKSEKIMAKLGDKAHDYLIMETADALLSPEELEAKRSALLRDLDDPNKTAKKVGEKAVQLFGWVRNGGKLNEYMQRAFKVLAEDGQLSSGVGGNLQKNYLARPYAPGTASAQANQIFQLFPLLKLTVREKGVMKPNPDSVLLTTILTKLGLTLKTE
jgi:hypothetical protein